IDECFLSARVADRPVLDRQPDTARDHANQQEQHEAGGQWAIAIRTTRGHVRYSRQSITVLQLWHQNQGVQEKWTYRRREVSDNRAVGNLGRAATDRATAHPDSHAERLGVSAPESTADLRGKLRSQR